MSCITRCVTRWGLIGALGLGGLTLLVGPDRVATGFSQLRSNAQGVVDRCVDNPVALRRQLAELADEYPDRIAEVRGELAEVNHQIAQLDRDIEIATKVVAYTTDDLQTLQGHLARAGQFSGDRPVFIRFEGIRFDVSGAENEAIRISTVRNTYRDRLAMDQQQAQLLDQQQQRLGEILRKLEDDYETYQTQLYTLDRQIDAIERNDRLIELIEDQQATLQSYDRYSKVGSLQQLEAKLVELQKVQQAQIDILAKQGIRDNYEERAELEMDTQYEVEIFDDLLEEAEGQNDGVEASTASNSLAWADPIIIE